MTDGQKIKARREELNMSVEQLAKLIGVHKSTISRYERDGISTMPYMTFFKLLLALQTTPDKILPEEENELIEKSDELKGFYDGVSQKQREMMKMMKDLPPEDEHVVDVMLRGLLGGHKE